MARPAWLPICVCTQSSVYSCARVRVTKCKFVGLQNCSVALSVGFFTKLVCFESKSLWAKLWFFLPCRNHLSGLCNWVCNTDIVLNPLFFSVVGLCLLLCEWWACASFCVSGGPVPAFVVEKWNVGRVTNVV